ncbi:MAG: hypothetical protein JNM66_11120 [Bryobacterales bacterium]|nr:hypothetical protein [Bryobacterales bacterium]
MNTTIAGRGLGAELPDGAVIGQDLPFVGFERRAEAEAVEAFPDCAVIGEDLPFVDHERRAEAEAVPELPDGTVIRQTMGFRTCRP